ncbi:MAG: NAD(P)(+) transhydrogenase (Re/Si-specific) subunit beta [Deltaproteobacteria bacterium]|nr:NAD(P)(+) transhydrogenase (Re/Si-specific) subunit beta [Deltaproteobacteria bacterium]
MPALELSDLFASVLFVLGIKGLARPRTAARANWLGIAGMSLAVATAIFVSGAVRVDLIVLGVALGSAIGILLAVKSPLTAMPEMVALLNGFGGLASVLVATHALTWSRVHGADARIAGLLSIFIGSVTFSGSVVAFLKLREVAGLGRSIRLPLHVVFSLALALASLGLGTLAYPSSSGLELQLALALASGLLGVILALPIGGADMPVVIALLNSYSGLAAAATGFVLSSSVLIIAGAIVGASGIILTQIMCKAMNRSMLSVVFGTMPAGAAPGSQAQASVKSTTAEEVAMILEAASSVVIVPGYGLAVAQAQHALKDLVNTLEARGVRVELGIHPVAGRMPGHMNVLLAEAEIDYEKTKTLEEINPTMRGFDVALVVGANDIVNPVARTDPSSPIAGMPILDVDYAKSVIVVKRSMAPGFAGIANPLFHLPNTVMFFEDAKKALLTTSAALSHE